MFEEGCNGINAACNLLTDVTGRKGRNLATDELEDADLCVLRLAATHQGSKFTFMPQFPPPKLVFLGVGYLTEGTHADPTLLPEMKS